MALDLGAFWSAAAPGINHAINQVGMHQQAAEAARRQIEHDMAIRALGGDEFAQAWGSAALQQLSDPHYKSGAIMKDFQAKFHPPEPAAGPAAGPAAAGAGVTGAPAGAPPPGAPAVGTPAAASAAAQPQQFNPSEPVTSGPGAAAAGPAKPAIPAGGASLPTANPTVNPGAMKPPAGAGAGAAAAPGAPAGGDPMLSTMQRVPQYLEAAGIHPPGPAPDPAKIKEQTAQLYGGSSAQLEDPAYAYTNHMPDARKAKIQQTYLGQAEKAQEFASEEHRRAATTFTSSVQAIVADLLRAQTAETGNASREKVADTRAQAADSRAEASRVAAEDREEKRYTRRQAELDRKEKQHTKDQATRARQATVKEAPGVATIEAQANADYLAATGEAWPGSKPAARPTSAPPVAAPTGPRAAAAATATPAAPAAPATPSAPPPPKAPLTPTKFREAAGIMQQLQRSGGTVRALPPEIQDLLIQWQQQGGKLQ